MPASCYSPFLQRVGEHLTLLFPLTEGETNSNATASADYSCNQAGSLLLGGDSSHWLVSSSGVSLSGSGSDRRLTSNFALDTVLQQAAAAGGGVLDGWSVEVWLLPATVVELNEIMTVGAVEPTGTVDQYASLSSGNSLVLLQNGSSYTFLVQLNSGGGTQYALVADMPTSFNPQPYSVTAATEQHWFHPLSSTPTPVLTQLVLVLNSTLNTMEMFVNGHLAATLVQPFDSPLSTWFTSASILSFAQTSHSAATAPLTWLGSIRLVAMYSSSLSPADVQTNWIAGTPPNVPQPPASTNVSWSWPQPYFSINVSTSSPVLVTIRSLPVPGVLAVYNATSNTTTVLTVSQLPIRLNATGVVTFRYWPPATMNGSYVASFNYTLASPNAPTSPSNPGTVSFVVSPSITPPLPINQSVQAVAQVPLLLQLTGVDEDSTSAAQAIAAAYIVSLPAYGELFQVNADGSAGSLISASAVPVAVTDAELRVWYVSRPGQLALSAKPVVLPLHTFGFTVEVKETVSTVVGYVLLTVNNSMAAVNSSTVLLDSNATLVTTQGSDALNETFTYTVVAAPTHGVLVDSDNTTLEALTPFLPPVYYRSSQQRDSGRYNRQLMPLPDSFTFATVSATGILSVPANASITFAPTLGPPLLTLTSPANPTTIIVSEPANFSASINPAGLSNPLTTVWLVTLSVSPATGRVSMNATNGTSDAAASAVIDVDELQMVQFEASTDDANLLLSHLSFSSDIVNTYAITLTVQNDADRGIESAATTSVTTVPTLTTASSGNVSGLLPFNALYLWVTIGILVFLVVLALCIRRCVSDKDNEPVMTNEERHILNKVRAGAGLGGSVGERLDGGIKRASGARAVAPGGGLAADGDKSSEEKKEEAEEKERQQTVPTLIGFFGGGGGKGKRPMKLTPSNEDNLSMTPILPAAAEVSHLGSRIDTELWGQHVGQHAALPQPQQRGVQLRPMGDTSIISAAPFDPYATGNLEPYQAMQTQPISLGFTQMLASSLTDSQLLGTAPVIAPVVEQPAPGAARRVPRILTPTVSTENTARRSNSIEKEEKGQGEAAAAAQSSFGHLHAAHAPALQRSLTPSHLPIASHSSFGPNSSAGVLASPRINPTPAAASTLMSPISVIRRIQNVMKGAEPVNKPSGGAVWRAEAESSEQPALEASPQHRRAHSTAPANIEPLQLEEVDNTPPAATATTSAQPRPAQVQRTQSQASGVRRGRAMLSRSMTSATAIEVPVNPMFPVAHGDTPRYAPVVYNTQTKRRQLSISQQGGGTPRSPREEAEEEAVVDSVNRQHPLFEHNQMQSTQQLGMQDVEEEL